jgi:hypothetical protein
VKTARCLVAIVARAARAIQVRQMNVRLQFVKMRSFSIASYSVSPFLWLRCAFGAGAGLVYASTGALANFAAAAADE